MLGYKMNVVAVSGLHGRSIGSQSIARKMVVTMATTWDGPPVVIVGAGVAGVATALALTKVGVPVKVLEASASLRAEGSAAGLWANAWSAMDVLGVADKLRADFIPLNRVELCRGESGKILRDFDFDECDVGKGQEFRGVLRTSLLQALASELPPDMFTFNAPVTRISKLPSTDGTELELEIGGGAPPLRCSMLIGTDGVRSVVAKYLGLDSANYAGYIAYRGVASTSPDSVGLPENTIRQIWGAGVRAGLYPITKDKIYWFVTSNVPEDAPIPPTKELILEEALKLVEEWPWKIDTLIKATPLDMLNRGRMTDRWTPPGSFGSGLVTLAGDAAHPMTPNLGQGACTALEDAVVLAAEVANVLRGEKAAGANANSPLSVRLEEGLRRYEASQSKRTLPLTVRANLMGTALQIDNPLVCTVRDTFVSNFFSPAHFLDHTAVSLPSLEVLKA